MSLYRTSALNSEMELKRWPMCNALFMNNASFIILEANQSVNEDSIFNFVLEGNFKDKDFVISIIDCFAEMDRAAYPARSDLDRLGRHKDEDVAFAARAVLKFWANRAAAAAKAAPAENTEGNR